MKDFLKANNIDISDDRVKRKLVLESCFSDTILGSKEPPHHVEYQIFN